MKTLLLALLLPACAAPRSASRDLPLAGTSPSPKAPPATLDFFLRKLPPPGTSLAVADGGTQLQALAYVGREDRIAAAEPPRAPCQPLQRNGVEVDPLAEIVELAKTRQIVIVNEAHDAPSHRAFIADVAGALRPLGFSIYAAETLSSKVGRDGPSYPLRTDGGYSNEPIFGDLLRRARALGYAFVPYEHHAPASQSSPEARMSEREEGQADNLVHRIFDVDPQARVLIHAGYAHASNVALGNLHMMAQWLKEKTQIDPLTVDQTVWDPAGDRPRLCATPQLYDLEIIPAQPRFLRGRPTWRIGRGQHPSEVPPALRRPRDRVIIEARRTDEPDDAVPVDRILIDPGEDLPLLLPPGEYRLRARTLTEPWSTDVSLTVH